MYLPFALVTEKLYEYHEASETFYERRWRQMGWDGVRMEAIVAGTRCGER